MQESRRAKGRPRWLLSLLVLLILSAGFAAIDLGVKSLVFSRYGGSEANSPIVTDHRVTVIPGVLFLQLATNPGGLFGLGPGHLFILISLSLVTMLFVLWMYFSFGMKQRTTKVALAFILGGALGNLADRIAFGAVRDFLLIDIGVFKWPNFNVADVWICIGAGLLVLWMIRHPEPKQGPLRAGKK